MNAMTSHIMKRTSCLPSLGLCLFVVSAADASAHVVEYRPPVTYNHVVYIRTRSYPAWLAPNREFQRWYLQSRYRFVRRMTWRRIYDRYLYERRYYRDHRRRKYYGHVYHDSRFRTDQKYWRKRKH